MSVVLLDPLDNDDSHQRKRQGEKETTWLEILHERDFETAREKEPVAQWPLAPVNVGQPPPHQDRHREV